MWKRIHRLSIEGEENSSETLSDLSLSMLGVLMIAFTGYILKFRSEIVAHSEPQTPPVAVEEFEKAIRQLEKELRIAHIKQDHLKKQTEEKTKPLGNPQLFGLNGSLTNIAFCLDLSGSMVGENGQNYSQSPAELANRFEEVKDRLKLMVRSLGFQNFTVIGFGGNGQPNGKPRLVASTNGLVPATEASREAACRQIDLWQAGGGTPTLPALQAAYRMPGVEHVVLLTDGLPTLGGKQEDVLSFLRSNRGRVVVDVVGVGDQSVQPDEASSMALLDFTRSVARITGGFFQAW
ncbi:vWA domain-containing protein [Adhaeretor mobilis]|uniref:von Willebrand factor type A domain protein n=1 Tax=Adhaeretor mobilis TaxID=1930276 RepID=A0A517MQM2_9BACT|nr:VWA domain-containing protein [Adhaeretor mobilis]QDS97077.1 von Willebrand factor type A domain protein [Adhaeretor mobilis]